MEPSKEGAQTLARSVVHWRSVILIGVSVAGGLALTSMVIGATPTVGGQAAAAPEAALVAGTVVDPTTTVLVDPSTTEATTGSTEVVTDPTQTTLAVPATGGAVVAPGGGAVPVTRAAQPSATPTAVTPSPAPPNAAPSQRAAEPSSTPTAPTTAGPTKAAPTKAVPAAPAPGPAAAPAPAAPTTAAPTTAAPTTAAPTTAAPTTAAPSPVALSYPSYTVSGVSGVSLQFDGSSIVVASVSPQANWVYQIASNGPRTVEIKFYNTANGTDREFHATVENGRIKVET